MTLNEFEVVGRHRPTEAEAKPKLYRMRIFAKNDIVARSRFWYFMRKLHRVKKAAGEILSTRQLYEKKPLKVKNFGVLLRYDSRTGTHNLYKEFRDLSRVGAIDQLYKDMAGRHRARFRSVQVLDVKEISSSQCKRPYTTQFHNPKIRFPLPHRVQKKSFNAKYRTLFRACCPSTIW